MGILQNDCCMIFDWAVRCTCSEAYLHACPPVTMSACLQLHLIDGHCTITNLAATYIALHSALRPEEFRKKTKQPEKTSIWEKGSWSKRRLRASRMDVQPTSWSRYNLELQQVVKGGPLDLGSWEDRADGGWWLEHGTPAMHFHQHSTLQKLTAAHALAPVRLVPRMPFQ